MISWRRWAIPAAFLLLLVSCNRERRHLIAAGPQRARNAAVRVSTIQPGPKMPAVVGSSAAEGNAYDLSEGQRLFTWYNCAGCHSHGGGGMGPALMDDQWIYGDSPANIHDTIVEGRPNGMPSYGGHIPDYQVWQLVAYVRSMSNLERKAATAPRADEMQWKRAQGKAPEQLPPPIRKERSK